MSLLDRHSWSDALLPSRRLIIAYGELCAPFSNIQSALLAVWGIYIDIRVAAGECDTKGWARRVCPSSNIEPQLHALVPCPCAHRRNRTSRRRVYPIPQHPAAGVDFPGRGVRFVTPGWTRARGRKRPCAASHSCLTTSPTKTYAPVRVLRCFLLHSADIDKTTDI